MSEVVICHSDGWGCLLHYCGSGSLVLWIVETTGMNCVRCLLARSTNVRKVLTDVARR
jgi:Zn-finger protein